MQYVRPLADATFLNLGLPGFEASVVSQLESVMTLGARVAPGGCGPGLHYHASDQFYFVLDGDARVQLGAEEHDVPAGSLVFVPAGVAHRSWNDRQANELHLEFLVPSIGAGRPLLMPVADVSEAPGSDVAPFVTRIDDERFAAGARESGFAVQQLVDRSQGVTSCAINAILVNPGGAGPSTHIHTFDQLYFILEGELQVEVALQRHVAPRHSLVVLPAGVPHTQWNEGPGREIHLAVLAPAPEAGRPLTVPVNFTSAS
jgi:mannose-6-phosphate isomerase-like protein (cupin superfamily)